MGIFRLLKLTSAFFILSLLVACGSGGGSDSAATGRVSLLVTDGVTDEFDQVNLTVESISFLGAEDGHQSIVFNESRVINLLALQNHSDLLVTAVIPAGTYDKIRLHVSQVELVKFVEGGEPESYIAKLPANGKVDLNPRGTFEVIGDGHLMMELDVDAEKSIHIVEKGTNRIEYNFRPVVFVKIIDVVDESKLVLLDGRVLAKTENGFKLCDVQLTQVDDSCIAVLISENTVVQNDLVEPVPADNMMDGDIVTVLAKVAGENISALHIVIEDDDKEVSDLALFTGAASSVVAAGDFTMVTDDDNGMVPPLTALTVSMVDGSGVRIFDKYGNELAADAILAGTDVDVFGLFIPEAQVKAAFVIIDNDTDADRLGGSIIAINEADSLLTVLTEPYGDYCVDINEAILLLLDIVDSKVTASEITSAELVEGMPVDIYGRVDGSGCFAADVVLVAPVPAVPLNATQLVTGY